MFIKYRYILSFGLVIAGVIFVIAMGIAIYTDNSSVTVDLTSREWAQAVVIKQGGNPWCPPSFSVAEGKKITIDFANSEKIVVLATEKGKATITLEPEILMEAISLQKIFKDFELSEGEILHLTLDTGEGVQIFVCGNRIYLIGPAFG